ncbi:hypothetical protein BST97_06110 [Nonlabens spongiae]|uniref:EamA domain-containing protein n=1 Tax=Nonlabens spongiae TaxID=331648 RepID=A0A1W6MJ32_9FLAO|nr:DMT family transporter [Nonlabens spongiae]ARN77600.1 hypothetical protein BST97_06110 [Nonlabens spongiae]
MGLSSIMLSVMNALVKYLEGFSAFQLIFIRSLITLIFISLYLKHKNINLIGNERKLMLIRGVFGTISLFLFFYSLKFLNLGIATVIRYLSPVFAAVLAIFWLRQKVAVKQWLYFAMAFLGVALIEFYHAQISILGTLIAILSALSLSVVFVSISKIGNRDHPLVIINYFMLVGTVSCGIACLFQWVSPSFTELLIILCLVIVGLLGQIFMTMAFQGASPKKVAPFKYLEVLFTLLLGVTFFSEEYGVIAILGVFLVLTGIILNTLYLNKKNRLQRSTN